MKYLQDLTEAEIDAIVRGYSDVRLAENYQRASKHPGTDWARMLSAEIGRRDALGIRVHDEGVRPA